MWSCFIIAQNEKVKFDTVGQYNNNFWILCIYIYGRNDIPRRQQEFLRFFTLICISPEFVTLNLYRHIREREERVIHFSTEQLKKNKKNNTKLLYIVSILYIVVSLYIFLGCFETGAISIDFSLGIDSSTVYYPTHILNNKFNFDSFLISHLFGLCCI